MKKTLLPLKTSFLVIAFLFINKSFTQHSQDVLNDYITYAEAPRELAYVHLNKSTFIEGEMMGFTAYIIDKFSKSTSKETQNLYCTINDENGNVIKKKLLKVENGVTSNVFYIDSTLSSGVFTFKAYTNWMRNFSEPNHFQQTFKVINADNNNTIKPITPKDFDIDLQILGEGGHILYNVKNTVGIIAKNQFGKGIKNARGVILDSSNNVVAKFLLNEVGVGKTIFIPNSKESYFITLETATKTLKKPINDIKLLGVVMSVLPSKENLILNLKTNQQTLENSTNQNFKVGLHNGHNMLLTYVSLNKNGEAILLYPKEELNSGINIFTVFNNDDQPILERLYFNNNFKKTELTKVKVKPSKDSLSVKLNLKNLTNSDNSSHLSVSVLPVATKSYNHNNNIFSQLYIQPYVNSTIENGAMYFDSNNKRASYNLDLLMLTQGWSSYDWTKIFNYNDKFIYPFERGIDIVANINKSKNGTYLVYPNRSGNTQLFNIANNEKEFTIKSVFPNEKEKLRIGFIENEKTSFNKKPTLALQYFPNSFPLFSKDYKIIEESYTLNDYYVKGRNENKSWDINKVEALDEVVVKADKRYTKFEELKQKAIVSRFEFIEENIKLRGMRIDLYLQRLGWATDFDIFSGKLSIINPRGTSKDKTPLVYLDGALLTTSGKDSDFGILTFLTMDSIDYIEYELYGIGGGIRGNAGFIKIFTGTRYNELNPIDNVVTYEAPLNFSKDKTFYTPKYYSYKTDFFKEYGTVGWLPKLDIENGIAEFKVPNIKSTDITLYIEGVLNENQLISQKITVNR
ncbi:hypothetical protein [Winogradskyella sp. PE311]|uniref:hypothetical protein n=1 Tax=Winogradskyella sp. PE311 TaxID=3366943 RepID=UPI00397F307F